MHAAFFERRFHALAPDDAPLQLPVRDGQFRRALIERLRETVQIKPVLPRRAMRFHDRDEGFGEKTLGVFYRMTFGMGRAKRGDPPRASGPAAKSPAPKPPPGVPGPPPDADWHAPLLSGAFAMRLHTAPTMRIICVS